MRAMGSSQRGFNAILPIEIPPAALGVGQLRVQVIARALNRADLLVQQHALTGRLLHSTKPPLVPGYDFSGVVTEVGTGAEGCAAGDEVFGHLAYSSKTSQGACAETIVVDAAAVAKKPAGIDQAQAACAATTGLTALQFLRDLGKLTQGQRLLVLGAAGGVGARAVGIGKCLGAHVTAVCASTLSRTCIGSGPTSSSTVHGRARWSPQRPTTSSSISRRSTPTFAPPGCSRPPESSSPPCPGPAWSSASWPPSVLRRTGLWRVTGRAVSVTPRVGAARRMEQRRRSASSPERLGQAKRSRVSSHVTRAAPAGPA